MKHLAGTLNSMSVKMDEKEMEMAVLNGVQPGFKNVIVSLHALENEHR